MRRRDDAGVVAGVKTDQASYLLVNNYSLYHLTFNIHVNIHVKQTTPVNQDQNSLLQLLLECIFIPLNSSDPCHGTRRWRTSTSFLEWPKMHPSKLLEQLTGASRSFSPLTRIRLLMLQKPFKDWHTPGIPSRTAKQGANTTLNSKPSGRSTDPPHRHHPLLIQPIPPIRLAGIPRTVKKMKSLAPLKTL